jgi:hypothetical protein
MVVLHEEHVCANHNHIESHVETHIAINTPTIYCCDWPHLRQTHVLKVIRASKLRYVIHEFNRYMFEDLVYEIDKTGTRTYRRKIVDAAYVSQPVRSFATVKCVVEELKASDYLFPCTWDLFEASICWRVRVVIDAETTVDVVFSTGVFGEAHNGGKHTSVRVVRTGHIGHKGREGIEGIDGHDRRDAANDLVTALLQR